MPGRIGITSRISGILDNLMTGSSMINKRISQLSGVLFFIVSSYSLVIKSINNIISRRAALQSTLEEEITGIKKCRTENTPRKTRRMSEVEWALLYKNPRRKININNRNPLIVIKGWPMIFLKDNNDMGRKVPKLKENFGQRLPSPGITGFFSIH